MTVDELNVIISAKTQGLNQQLAGVKKQMAGLESSVSKANTKITSAFSKIGKAVLAAFSVKAIVSFGKQAISLASDLQEVENVVTTAFGGMSAVVDKWSKTTVDKFGMSELSAKRTASTYMAMSKGMGLAGEQAAEMAMKVAERTGDIASFYNMSQQEADTMLKSIWTGETESLKRIGVVMTQTNLDAYALANGFGKTTDAMSQQEQVMLRYQYVMEQTGLAAGDFEKTSGSWANQTRVLSERFKELLSVLGSGLLQVLTPVVQFLNTVLEKLIQAATVAGQMISSLFGGKAKEAQSTAQNVQNTATSMGNLTKQTEAAGKAAKAALAGFDELNVLGSGTTAEGAGGAETYVAQAAGMAMTMPEPDTSGVKSTADKIKGIFADLGKYITTKFAPTFSSWGKAFVGLKDPAVKAFDSIKGSLSGLWENTLKPAGAYLIGNFIPSVSNAFSETFAPIFGDIMPVLFEEFATGFNFACGEVNRISQDILAPAFEQVKTVATGVFDGIKKSWDEHGKGILDGFHGFRESMREIWNTLYTNAIKPVFDRIAGIVKWLWDDHLKPLWDNISDFIGSAAEFLLELWNKVLAPIVKFIVEKVGPPITTVIGFIGDVFGSVFGVIADVVGGFLKQLSGLIDFLTGVFTGNWKKAWSGIEKFVKGTWDGIWGIIKGVVNLIVDGLNLLWSGIYNVVSGIVNGIGGIAKVIGKLFGQDWGFSMPKEPPLIPKLATGGLAYGPTLAMIGEGADREAVLPLNADVYGEIANGIQAAGGTSNRETITLLERILTAIGQIDPTIVMDGTTLARTSDKYFAAEQRRRGPSLVKVV